MKKQEPFILKKPSFLQINLWESQWKGLTTGFTTRKNGHSQSPYESLNLGLHVGDNAEHVEKNRKKLAETLGFPLQLWICTQQTHEKVIQKVAKEHASMGIISYKDGLPGVDGMYTDEPNILLTTGYADCVPLYFIYPDKKLIGVAHAGWQGTVKNIAGEMIRLWEGEEGVQASDIQVAIGPSINPCCYIVDDRVKEKVEFVLGGEIPPHILQEESPGQYRLALKEVNRQLLLAAGVKEENILVSHYCTSCEENLFFSHRRDKGQTGRMMSFLGWKEG